MRQVFRLFVSSTFSDFTQERKVLQQSVFPEIHQFCKKNGYTFQPIDLRWGVSDEAQLDQKTLELCLKEVEACNLYPHPNFLIMAGDRYGWVPTPYSIEKREFEMIQTYVKESDISLRLNYKELTDQKAYRREVTASELLLQWYKLDYNHIPTSYILQERSSNELSNYLKYENWEVDETALREVLQDAVEKLGFSEVHKAPYFTSATEAEVKEGILSFKELTASQKRLNETNPNYLSEDQNSTFAFIRNYLVEDQEVLKEVESLKEHIRSSIIEDNIFEKTVDMKEKSYLVEFEERMKSFLIEHIEEYMQKQKKLSLSALEIETQQQKEYASQKRKNFLGQERLREKILHYINRDEISQALVIYGKSGSGKSSLMAKAIEDAQEASQKRVVYRFVGATTEANSSKSILLSLFDELGVNLREKVQKDERLETFSQRVLSQLLTLKEDIVIFIDAVDQLQHSDEFLWLPKELPANIKIVISALQDENYEEDTHYFNSLQILTTNLQKMQPFEQPRELLRMLLQERGRRVTSEQEDDFYSFFQELNTPLYIPFCAQMLQHLNHNVSVIPVFQNTQTAMVESFVESLSTKHHHNKRFVHRVLSYLYASQDGLSESELLQLLSEDKLFVEEMAPETWHENVTKELPFIHWSRLQTALSPFLSIKESENEELLYFFHREFEDVIQKQPRQQEEHEAIIVATQNLIERSLSFQKERWGKLYASLILGYLKRYPHAKRVKEYISFIVTLEDEIWQIEYMHFLLLQSKRFVEEYKSKEVALFVVYMMELSRSLYEKDREFFGAVHNSVITLRVRVLTDLEEYMASVDLLEEYLSSLEQESLYREKVQQMLVKSYLKLKKYDLAQELVDSLLDTSTSTTPLEDRGDMLNSKASILLEQKRYRLSLAYFIQAYKIIEHIYSEHQENWIAKRYISVLSSLGSVYTLLGNEERSFYYLQESFQVVTTLYDKDNTLWKKSYIESAMGVGIYHMTNNHNKEALRLFKKSLMLIRKMDNQTRDSFRSYHIKILENLGLVEVQLLHFSQAKVYLNNSYRIAKESYGEEDEKTKELKEVLTLIDQNDFLVNPVMKKRFSTIIKKSSKSAIQEMRNASKDKDEGKVSLTELLYLSKYRAQSKEKKEITVEEFKEALGYIELNPQAKEIFSLDIDLSSIVKLLGATSHIEYAKTTQKITYSKDLKVVIKHYKEIFAEVFIGEFVAQKSAT